VPGAARRSSGVAIVALVGASFVITWAIARAREGRRRVLAGPS